MIYFPNAKINIGLDILRRRDDGYHDISTVMYPIGWCDVLELVPGKGDRTTLAVSGNGVACPVEKNLVMKAVRLLESMTDVPPTDIYLHKIIPDGAGMGGGSSDAAFALRGLNELYSLGLGKDALAELASRLGADCPFFIYNEPMLAEGIGERLSKMSLDLSGCGIVVVKPGFSISTAEAYGGVKPMVPERHLTERLGEEMHRWRGTVVNAFTIHLAKKYTEISEITERLLESGALYASMTGSGSAVYGIFENAEVADSVRRVWENESGDWRFYSGGL